MTISDYIQAIAAQVNPSGSYQYGRNTDFNINGDGTASPVILCIEPDQQFLNLSTLTGNIYDGYNLFIRFLTLRPTIAEQAPDRVQAIADMKLLAASFISQLSNDDNFQDIPSRIPIIEVIDAYDGNYCGVEINLQNLQLINPVPVCP